MKRLIISLGLAWALIYTANHTVFVRAASDTDAKVATSIEQVSTDRRIVSWGPYLPNVRPPLPDENPAVSPSQTRQPRQVAARQIETDSASSADTSPAPKKESSDIGAKARPHAKPLPRGCSIWNFKHSVAEASAAEENSVVSLDGSKHATVNPVGLNKRPLNAGSDRRNEFNIAKTESHSYRPRFLSYARVQRHSSVGRRQLDRAM